MEMPRHYFVMDFEASCDDKDAEVSTLTISSVVAGQLTLPQHRLCTGAKVVCSRGAGVPLRIHGDDLAEGMTLFAQASSLDTLQLFETKEAARRGEKVQALQFDEGSGAASVLQVQPGEKWTNEIIEFPGVLLDAVSMGPVAEFRAFVKPTENPTIPLFTTTLTSITQADVDSGETLDVVLRRLDDWLREHGAAHALPVTCGDWDLGTMLPQECKRKGLDDLVPSALRRWCNVKRAYQSTMGVKGYPGMAKMLRALNIPLVGHHHLGIDDARNIAKIAQELVRRGGRIEATAPAVQELQAGDDQATRTAAVGLAGGGTETAQRDEGEAAGGMAAPSLEYLQRIGMIS